MMNLQTLSDRMAIQDLLAAYCHAVDARDWVAFTGLFTADAKLDFSAFGGPVCGVLAMTEFLEGVLRGLHPGQHTISTARVEIDGDHARARTAALVMVGSPRDEAPGVTQVGLWYRDSLMRTPSGWRIDSRVQEYGWVRA
jgi:hypothetical protein